VSIDVKTDAAGRFYSEIQAFSAAATDFSTVLFYQVKPDERHDLTLISERVYHNRYESLAIMAAAGLDRVDQDITERLLVLPTEAELIAIKRKTGFESRPAYRERLAPIWAGG
jgi:hypothetical protein